MNRTGTVGRSTSWDDACRGVIVIGCHRSGTSLVAGLLRQMGVQMGADCGHLVESAFFRDLNVGVLRAVGASWWDPAPVRGALADQRQCEALVAHLRHRVGSPSRRRYHGPAAPDAAVLGPGWGWKDPRTTLTLPLWRAVFRGVRVVHVVRNGVDVAQSLVLRERTPPQPRFVALRRALDGVRARLLTMPEYEPVKARPFRDLHEAFALWADYVRFGIDATAPLPPGTAIDVRYEDMLSDPEPGLRRLADLLGVTLDQAQLRSLTAGLTVGRRLAFAADAELRRFYDEVQGHPLMQRFGYDTLPAPAA